MSKKRGLVCLVSIFALVFSVSLVSAQTEGIPLQKDVILGVPIYGPEDLPEEITFTLYDAQNGLTPLAAQTFTRGQYTVDFEFSQSDGVTGGSVARVKADFTQPLNLKDASGQTLKPKELWAALEVAGAEVGARTKVSDETLVRLLLNSDASLATYLTLAYEGDDNPLTTIYKDLPISLSSSDGSKKSLSSYFSTVAAGTVESRQLGVAGSDGQIQYNNNSAEGGAANFYYDDVNGRVGIGTAIPANLLHLSSNRNTLGFESFRLENLAASSPSYLKFGIGYPGMYDTYALIFKDNTLVQSFTTDQVAYYADRLAINTNSIIHPIQHTNSYFRFTSSNNVEISSWADTLLTSNGATLMTIKSSGNIGIGTTNPTAKLSVNGDIVCTTLGVTADIATWPDFVFEDNYRLPSLSEVENFISQNKHLPGIPSRAEVGQKGLDVGDISSRLLQKIEELTLYVIDVKKENDSLRMQMATMESLLKVLKDFGTLP